VVLSGYKVPAGVLVTMPMLVIGRMEQYFPNSPEKFIPDRWNREGEYPKNRFVFLPFGFGPRMCIGRRVAELEVHIAIAQIIKKFNIEYPDPTPIDYILKGVLVPRKQFNLIFKDI
jgi:cytochrome P450